MRRLRPVPFAAAMLCFASSGFLMVAVYDAPMDPTILASASEGETVVLQGELSEFSDERLADWQGDGNLAKLDAVAGYTVIVRYDDVLPHQGQWVIHGTIAERQVLDNSAWILIDAQSVTAPLVLA